MRILKTLVNETPYTVHFPMADGGSVSLKPGETRDVTMTRHFVTKGALTRGIRIVDGGTFTEDEKYFKPHDDSICWVSREHVFETLEQATAKVLEMHHNRIEALRKELAILEDPEWRPKLSRTENNSSLRNVWAVKDK